MRPALGVGALLLLLASCVLGLLVGPADIRITSYNVCYTKLLRVGLDQQRLSMHLAVLHRHCGVTLADQDVFANVVGGVRIGETGASYNFV